MDGICSDRLLCQYGLVASVLHWSRDRLVGRRMRRVFDRSRDAAAAKNRLTRDPSSPLVHFANTGVVHADLVGRAQPVHDRHSRQLMDGRTSRTATVDEPCTRCRKCEPDATDQQGRCIDSYRGDGERRLHDRLPHAAPSRAADGGVPARIDGEGATWRQGSAQHRSNQPEADKERGKGEQHPPIRSHGDSDDERHYCQH